MYGSPERWQRLDKVLIPRVEAAISEDERAEQQFSIKIKLAKKLILMFCAMLFVLCLMVVRSSVDVGWPASLLLTLLMTAGMVIVLALAALMVALCIDLAVLIIEHVQSR